MAQSEQSILRRFKTWVKDLPIFWKLIALPMLSLVVLIAVIGTDHTAFNILTNSASSLYVDQFEPTIEVTEVAADVNRAVSDLYLAFALAGDRQDLTGVARQLDEVRSHLDKLQQDIEDLAREAGDPALAGRLEKVATELEGFDQPIAFMRELLDVDAAAALDFLEPLQTQLDQVQAELGAAVAIKKETASLTMRRIVETAKLTEFLGASFAVLYLGVFLVLTPVFIRSVRSSIDRIASATQSLASGDLEIDIDSLRRNDEMGKIVDSLVIFRDSLVDREKLTLARKEIEEELLAANVQLSSVVNALNAVRDQILIESAEGKVTYFNQSAASMNALNKGVDVYGKNFADAVPLLGGVRQRYAEEIQAVLSTEDIWQRELKLAFPGKEGGHYDFHIANLPKGGVIYSVRDVSVQVRAAKREQDLRSQLSEAQKMQAIGQLAGGIAHDFNNMIAAMQGFAHLIEQTSDEESTSHQYANRIAKICGRAATLVREILMFARAEKAEMRPLNLADVARSTCADVRPTLPSHTPVIMRLPKNGTHVQGNESQIAQVVTNLLTNSSDACEGKSGKVLLYMFEGLAAPSEIHAFSDTRSGRLFQSKTGVLTDCLRVGSLIPGEKYTVLTVRDTGTGISSAGLQKVFDTFYTTKDGAGTGMGLSVVERIMVAHNGALEVRTKEGIGTRIKLYLPVSEDLSVAKDYEGIEFGHAERNARIMIVDDNVDVADTLSICFSAMGFSTAVFHEPHQAYAVYKDAPANWDVVLTDQVMGPDRGLDLINKLRELTPDGVFILMTGYDEDLTADLALEKGASAYFEKPLDQDQLASTIDRLLVEARHKSSRGAVILESA